MASPNDRDILFSPGPAETFILLCHCGNNEVSRDRRAWSRFAPDFDQGACVCHQCGRTTPLSYNDDAYRHRPAETGKA